MMGPGNSPMPERLDIGAITGLSESEAQHRLSTEGYNELPASGRRRWLDTVIEVAKEPMFLLLLAGGLIYLLIGETMDAMMLLLFVFVIMGISIYQQRKTERTLEALRDLSSPRALVIRDGVERRIVGREVARGDILVLSEGDRVPADAVVLHTTHLAVDESLLTGESIQVRKSACEGARVMERPGGDGGSSLFSGTLVVKGKGIAEAVATGPHTEIGKIGKVIAAIRPERTQLHRQTAQLVKVFAAMGLFLCAVVIVVYGLTRDDWMGALLAGITLAMAMIPEEFPVVLSIFLAVGAWRIAQSQVLTRRTPAVEALGAATVLCVDKTGTLTQNRMTVTKIQAAGEIHDLANSIGRGLPEAFHELVEFSILASQIDPFDPMERAFRDFGERYLKDTEHLHKDWALEQEYPLSEELLAMSHVWRSPGRRKRVIAAKGAPEAIADLCHMNQDERAALARDVDRLATEGLRVIAVARAGLVEPPMPEIQHDFEFQFLGLAGFSDPVRDTVPPAIRECHEAGIRVVMITGDYPATAIHVARQIGLPHDGNVVTGPELDAMDNATLAQRIRDVRIFARVVPEQKLRLVQALKAQGEIVAMTGDGVNDAPALKAADIGIAMGGRGTDVAREAADLVLLDDDFSSIVRAVRLGRRIFDNIRKAMAYILAIHAPIAGLTLIPVLLRWPLVLLPVHIVFLEMIIDPACSIVFEMEPEEEGIMKRRPRAPNAPLLGKGVFALSLLQGVFVLVVSLIVFAVAQGRGLSEKEARTLTFAGLIVANIALILANRSWSRTILESFAVRNPAVWWVAGAAFAFLALVIYTPGLQDIFHFAPLHMGDIGIAIAAGIGAIVWFEGFKLLRRRRRA